jgi:hypothetical protein
MANFGLIADDRPLSRALSWVRRGKAMTLPSSARPLALRALRLGQPAMAPSIITVLCSKRHHNSI